MLLTQIAAADQFKKANIGLSDQEYYDRFIAPYARERYRQAVGEGGAMQRGAKKTQGQLVSAQFGGRDTSMGQAATGSMAPTFRKAMSGVMGRVQQDVDRWGAQKMVERKQDVAKAREAVAQTNKLEAGVARLIPYAGEYIAAGTAIGGGLMDTAVGQALLDINKRPLRTVQFGQNPYEQDSPGLSMGGGGVSNLYNLSYA